MYTLLIMSASVAAAAAAASKMANYLNDSSFSSLLR